MQTKSILLTIGLLALAGATGGARCSQDTPPTSPDSDCARHMMAIKPLRGLNTAELRYKTKLGAYATRDDVAASDDVRVTLSGSSLTTIFFASTAPSSFDIFVSVTGPGQMAFTRTPLRAPSAAVTRVSPNIPAFAAAYAEPQA